MPATVPIRNAITVVTPTRPSVHGSFERDLGAPPERPERCTPKLAGQAVPEVLEVAREDALMNTRAELDLERVQRRPG